MTEYLPMIVKAHLANGFSAADSWSPSLDGILAYEVARRELSSEEFALGATGHVPLREFPLPLERVEFGDDWWYAVSSPFAATVAEHTVWQHRRFDLQQAIDALPPGTKGINTSAGPYKAYRNRLLVSIARDIRWFAVGDPAEVRRLLERVSHVGAKVGSGHGAVRRWEVQIAGDVAHAMALHRRPLPVDYVAQHGRCATLETAIRLDWGIRPPARAPEHQRLCCMPNTAMPDPDDASPAEGRETPTEGR